MTNYSQDGKIAETDITSFGGGITNDPRDIRDGVSRVVSNFDIISSPKKMIPYRSSESGHSGVTSLLSRTFTIALRSGTTYMLFLLGRQTASNFVQVQMKALTTGAATDLDDNGWDTPANNESASGAPNHNLFVYYQRTALIYGARNGTHIFAFDPTSVAIFNDTHQALTYTHIGQGLVHSKDDILYIPYYNNGGFIARNNNGTWNNTALTLPVHYIPTSICEYGNYLAISCVPTNGIGNSIVYLWDRDSSLTTIDESIDWGEGMLMVLETVDGELVGISQKGGTATSFSGAPSIPNATVINRDKVIFRKLNGGVGKKFLEIQANHAGSANTTQLLAVKQKVDNRLYFMMMIELNGAVRDGVWSIGRGPNNEFVLSHERTSNNNTALLTSDIMRGFFVVGDYIFIAFSTGGTHTITKTDDTSTYSHNSVYESKRFSTWGSSKRKDLLGTSVTYEYLPTAGDVTLQYRTDSTTAWTTISNDVTDNSISDSAVNIESSGVALPKFYKEIEFRILSTGGAEITGFSFKELLTDNRPY